MPIFEYECEKCKLIEDKIISYDNRNNPSKCRHCGAATRFVDKVHKGNFKLKGNGWYETDFKK